MRRWSFGFLTVPLLATTPLMAQETPPTGTVTVTSTRSTPEERRERARAFVRSTGVALGERPVARWVDGICLKVVGLPPEAAARVTARFTAIAREARAPAVLGGKCRPNALIAFVADGPATVREIAAKRGASLQDVVPSARKELLTGTAPIRWWYSTQARNVDGERGDGGQPPGVGGESNSAASGGGTGFSGATSGGQGLPGNGDTQFQKVRRVSLISTESMRALYAANVVVDVKRLQGVGLDAAADYASLVALAEIRPAEREQPESVLGIFAPPDPARRLTEWDAALLRALYRLPLDRSARLQRGALTAALIDQAERPQP